MEQTNPTQPYQPTRKPTFLVVLAVLSFIYMTLQLFGTVSSLVSGPMNEEQFEQFEAQTYQSMQMILSLSEEEIAEQLAPSIEFKRYENEHVFYLYNWLTLFTILLGTAAVIFMLRLNKIGFHMYVVYSLLPIIILYALFPSGIYKTSDILSLLFFGALFSVLYGLNLKHMNRNDSTEQE
jgi:hypothetical protein